MLLLYIGAHLWGQNTLGVSSTFRAPFRSQFKHIRLIKPIFARRADFFVVAQSGRDLPSRVLVLVSIGIVIEGWQIRIWAVMCNSLIRNRVSYFVYFPYYRRYTHYLGGAASNYLEMVCKNISTDFHKIYLFLGDYITINCMINIHISHEALHVVSMGNARLSQLKNFKCLISLWRLEYK